MRVCLDFFQIETTNQNCSDYILHVEKLSLSIYIYTYFFLSL